MGRRGKGISVKGGRGKGFQNDGLWSRLSHHRCSLESHPSNFCRRAPPGTNYTYSGCFSAETPAFTFGVVSLSTIVYTCIFFVYNHIANVSWKLSWDWNLTLSHKGVAGGMNVVGLFSCPPVHYALDWSRLVSTLVQEDKEEWWPVMCRKLVSDSFQTISKYFVQVLCCQFVQLGDSEDWWRGMYLLCKVFIYAAFHQFPSAHDRCQFLVGGQRGHCWFLIQTY